MKLSNLAMKALPRALVLGAVMAAACTSSAWAMLVDKQLVVSVVQVCDNAGNNCASLGPSGNNYFEAEVDKIWAQAGIDVKFVFTGKLNNSNLLNGSSGIDAITGGLAGPGTTMYLMNSIVGVYGNAWLDAGGLAISMSDVMSFNGGIGRLDTIAHELGHNLGLDHFDVANNLMASGGVRSIPSDISQICPGAGCKDFLTDAQITNVRDSRLLTDLPGENNVPEPASMALFGAALAAAGLARRRRDGR